jgi:lipopolysaccharide transport system ATP-binding protein
MSRPALRVRNLGKSYPLARQYAQGGYRTLRESLMEAAATPFRRGRGRKRSANETFWALDDVSFDVLPGEVVGIVGRNGAGKSTLLKILSRITRPTTGRAEIDGRVGSLLEVGTGFHPELTGRENVFLNGGILGMSRREVAGKFDEIVAFAEVERFLDTPVKRYSSGMHVRLAFAVAAHLEPEILIVDEVLAVGDAGFQRKCLEKMRQCATAGRTVLLVSHHMNSVRDLCGRAVWLADGRVRFVGSAPETIDRYFAESGTRNPPGEWTDLSNVSRTGAGGVRFAAAACWGADRRTAPMPDGPLHLAVRLTASGTASASLRVEAQVLDLYRNRLVTVNTFDGGQPLGLPAGESELEFAIERLHLNPGGYAINLLVGDATDLLDVVGDALLFDVLAPDDDAELGAGDSLVTRSFDWRLRAGRGAAARATRERA